MKAACIHCFSGTGNTLLATRRLAQALNEHGVATTWWRLGSPAAVEASPGALGIAFPVACQSTYPFVWDFVASLPPGHGRGVFVLDTLHMVSGGLLDALRRQLEAKGYRPLGAAEIRMPSNLALRAMPPEGVASVVGRAMAAIDAFADDLVAGLAKAAPQQQMEVDAFKLPHHGSMNNVTKALVEAVNCPCWLFSTDGTQFRHPDAVAIARVICYSAQQPVTLIFNVPSTFNRWWSNPGWKTMYGYETEYGNHTDGITIDFPINDDQ